MQHRVLESTNSFARTEIREPVAPRLTTIVPIGTSDFSFYRPRLEVRSKCDLGGIETILVDDCSPPSVAEEIKAFCADKGFRYLSTGSKESNFSLSRARNAGIFAATSDWLFFEDADVVYPASTLQRLAQEIELLADTPFNFVSMPTIYLAEGPSESILAAGFLSERKAASLVSKMLVESPLVDPKGSHIEHFVPASALILVRKKTAIDVGAYDEAFGSWGGEDRDFIYRLLHANPLLDRPPSFYATINTNMNKINEYKGWRALFRIHGDYLAAKGLYAFHLHHPPQRWKSLASTKTNFDLAAQKAAEIAKSNLAIPCTNPDAPPDIILGLNPHTANPQVYSALKNPCVVPENGSVPPAEFARSLIERSPARVIFWNPYGTEWRLAVYRELERQGVKTIVCERGALPQTLYFDETLSITSPSYDESKWDRPNTDEEEEAVAAYIDELRFGDAALERQSDRIGASLLRNSLGILPTIKVLFAPLQLETDTVTVHFSKPGRSYQDFVRNLRQLSLRLPTGWVLAYKNHPLSLTKAEMPSAICLDKYHINDALEACDAVTVFNSGTGLLSMAFEKPTYYFGQTFYGIDNVNEPFISLPQMRQSLKDLPIVDSTKVRRFYRYLTKEFYCFADWKVERKQAQNGKALVAKVNYLYYHNIRIPGRPPISFPPPARLSRDSILMDRYRAAPSTTSPAGAVVPVPAPPKKKANVSPNASAPNWGRFRKSIHGAAILTLSSSLNERDRQRLAADPVDFFKKAKWGPNRLFGRLLLDRSQRPY